jgi:serine/threonine protein kinase
MLNSSQTMCGTPSYLAPEVVTQQNSSGYDSLVDSWSVGVIMFSMLVFLPSSYSYPLPSSRRLSFFVDHRIRLFSNAHVG